MYCVVIVLLCVFYCPCVISMQAEGAPTPRASKKVANLGFDGLGHNWQDYGLLVVAMVITSVSIVFGERPCKFTPVLET